ncbi:MAG: hypothetical protein J2P37_23520, partial [Ktedonobacteraceae bacterium]|nr:hypothetical protein [Ktedonobacteraceae bacterium]
EQILWVHHGCQKLLIFPLQGVSITLFRIGKQMSGLMDPYIGLLDGCQRSSVAVDPACTSC